MNGISTSLFAVACAAFVGSGYLVIFRWSGSPVWLRCLLPSLVVVFGLGAWCFRTPLLFGSDSGFARWLRGFTRSDSQWHKVVSEQQYQRAQGEILGRYVSQQAPGSRCVILCAPALRNVSDEVVPDPLLEGLRTGLGAGCGELVEVEVPMALRERVEKDGELKTGLRSPEWSVESLSKLLSAAGDFGVLVSCVPLPEGCFGETGEVMCESLRGKSIALAAGVCERERKAISGGGVLAGVAYDDALPVRDDACPASVEEAFSRRYILLTKAGRLTGKSLPSAQ